MTEYYKIRDELLENNFSLFEYAMPKMFPNVNIQRFESWHEYKTDTSILVEVYWDGKAEIFAKTTKIVTKQLNCNKKVRHEKD